MKDNAPYRYSLLLLLIILVSCNAVNYDEKMISKEKDDSIKKEIVGVWELFKKSYHPSENPVLITPSNLEYLEIKSDGQCRDDNQNSIWFLSYTADYVIDSTSKVIFSQISNLTANSWGSYDRTILSYQAKIVVENNIKYLYLTSLNNSGTKVYQRKN